MNKNVLIMLCSLVALAGVSGSAIAAGDAALEHANVNIRDTAAAQRGARLFVNYCMSCHSASYMRYNRLAEDLGLGEEGPGQGAPDVRRREDR
jgi:ubiquinol-cytochrome c reductase cytochrome c1 subunit